ncbi:hypothetical protein [Microvirga pakistanensis]|uniref:hypothetical protein n=1 Tax=Microvirga pakistanensis TaxID=1682650 RepID=UPI00106AA8AA
MKVALQNYHARMRRVLDDIDRQLEGDLELETVRDIATFSKSHFYGAVRSLFTLLRICETQT